MGVGCPEHARWRNLILQLAGKSWKFSYEHPILRETGTCYTVKAVEKGRKEEEERGGGKLRKSVNKTGDHRKQLLT